MLPCKPAPVILTLIVNGGFVCCDLAALPHRHLPCFPAYTQLSFLHSPHMSSLIEGWFQLTNGRSFVDNASDTAAGSPRKSRSYLTLYDSCAILGTISSETSVDSDLRLYTQGQDLKDKAVHIHGRFSLLAANEEQPPHLQIDVHHFIVMPAFDAGGQGLPDASHTSVVICGCIVSAAEVVGSSDKFFMVEVSEYIRDRLQTFNIQFVMFSFVLSIS